MSQYRSKDEAALAEFDYALRIVARYQDVGPGVLRRSFRVRLVNTSSGAREYHRLTGAPPRFDLEYYERHTYGHTEEVHGTWFIFVNPAVWDSGHDTVPTFIHELLHVLRAQDEEAEIKRLEREICEREGIERDDILEDR